MATKQQLAVINAAFEQDEKYRVWFEENYNPAISLDFKIEFLRHQAKQPDWLFRTLYPVYCRAEWKRATHEMGQILSEMLDHKHRQLVTNSLGKSNFCYGTRKERTLIRIKLVQEVTGQ